MAFRRSSVRSRLAPPVPVEISNKITKIVITYRFLFSVKINNIDSYQIYILYFGMKHTQLLSRCEYLYYKIENTIFCVMRLNINIRYFHGGKFYLVFLF